jgi:hypothetical protein
MAKLKSEDVKNDGELYAAVLAVEIVEDGLAEAQERQDENPVAVPQQEIVDREAQLGQAQRVLNRLLAFRGRVEKNQSGLRGEKPSAEEKKEQAAREKAAATTVHNGE